MLHYPITCYRIHVLKISSLNYMFYMFLSLNIHINFHVNWMLFTIQKLIFYALF